MPDIPFSPLPENKRRWWHKIWPQDITPKQKVLILSAAAICILLAIAAGVVVAKMMSKKDLPAPVTGLQDSENDSIAEKSDTGADSAESKPDSSKPQNAPTGQTNQSGQSPANGGTGGNSAAAGTDTGNNGGSGGTPDPTPSCALPNYPDETCTGVPAGTALTVINGDLEVTVDGTVVDGKDVRGCAIIQAANVTIRNTKITCTSFYGVASYQSNDEGGLLLEDVEIDCDHHNGTGISFQGMIARRVHIHGCENGLDIYKNVVLEDSYIHDIYEGVSGHGDGIQSADGSDSSIIHNTIYSESTTSSININHNASGPTSSNILIKENLLAGGAYAMYCPIVATVNFRVINNHFSRIFHPNSGTFGWTTDCADEAEFSGNVWHDTGLPVIAQ